VHPGRSPDGYPYLLRRYHARFIQTLMLGNSWSYKEGTVFNVFSVIDSEQASHFLKLRILSYFPAKRAPSTRASAPMLYKNVVGDFVYLGYPRNHVKDAVRNLLLGGLLVSPNLPASSTQDNTVELPNFISPNTKVSLSSRGLYYLQNLAAHVYYQTRVGEDTVWYDEELVTKYIECLEESITAQGRASYDVLQATSAREFFITYLRRALQHEIDTRDNRYTATEWARKINHVVDRLICDDANRVLYRDTWQEIGEVELTPVATNGSGKVEIVVEAGSDEESEPSPKQMNLFGGFDIDINDKIREAIGFVGSLPIGLEFENKRYMVRILWALEVAYQAGLGPLRASDIARIIKNFGKEDVEATNVARFIRDEKKKGEYTTFWKEENKSHFSISQQGRDVFYSHLKNV
jgi:hypothetical protein